jgi:hypothetical protein
MQSTHAAWHWHVGEHGSSSTVQQVCLIYVPFLGILLAFGVVLHQQWSLRLPMHSARAGVSCHVSTCRPVGAAAACNCCVTSRSGSDHAHQHSWNAVGPALAQESAQHERGDRGNAFCSPKSMAQFLAGLIAGWSPSLSCFTIMQAQ